MFTSIYQIREHVYSRRLSPGALPSRSGGDIVVFEAQTADGGEVYLVKRVLGLPGDEIAVRDGVLFLNGVLQRESYLNRDSADNDGVGPRGRRIRYRLGSRARVAEARRKSDARNVVGTLSLIP